MLFGSLSFNHSVLYKECRVLPKSGSLSWQSFPQMLGVKCGEKWKGISALYKRCLGRRWCGCYTLLFSILHQIPSGHQEKSPSGTDRKRGVPNEPFPEIRGSNPGKKKGARLIFPEGGKKKNVLQRAFKTIILASLSPLILRCIELRVGERCVCLRACYGLYSM